MKTHIKFPLSLQNFLLAAFALMALASCKQLSDFMPDGQDDGDDIAAIDGSDSSLTQDGEDESAGENQSSGNGGGGASEEEEEVVASGGGESEDEEDPGEEAEPTPPAPTVVNVAFGSDGTVTTPIDAYVDRAYAVAIQSDGKIIAGGQYKQYYNEDHALVRYLEDGETDSTFGNKGIATAFFNKQNGSGHSDYLNAVAIQSDGKIVTGGVAYTYSGSFIGTFAVARWNDDGSLDTDFGKSGDGKVKTSFGNYKASALDIFVRSNGKIVAIGNDIGVGERVALAQYKANGSPDKNFGASSGTTLLNLSTHPTSGAMQGEKILVAGSSHEVYSGEVLTDAKKFAVIRFTEAGLIDSGFGSLGKTVTAIGSEAQAEHVVVQSDGKIILAGSAVFSGHRDAVVARYLSDGSLDPSFGGGTGWVSVDFGYEDQANAIAIQSDGKIVVAGQASQPVGIGGGSIDRVAVARFNADGSIDPSFGTSGKVTTAVGSSSIAYSLAIQTDGKIVVAGEAKNGNLDFAVLRYLPNGDLDAP